MKATKTAQILALECLRRVRVHTPLFGVLFFPWINFNHIPWSRCHIFYWGSGVGTSQLCSRCSMNSRNSMWQVCIFFCPPKSSCIQTLNFSITGTTKGYNQTLTNNMVWPIHYIHYTWKPQQPPRFSRTMKWRSLNATCELHAPCLSSPRPTMWISSSWPHASCPAYLCIQPLSNPWISITW